jgi:hypothetical protein
MVEQTIHLMPRKEKEEEEGVSVPIALLMACFQ